MAAFGGGAGCWALADIAVSMAAAMQDSKPVFILMEFSS
jgi:hypothetical protein